MNKTDREYLEYLKTLSEDEFDKLCDEVPESELDRMIELFQADQRKPVETVEDDVQDLSVAASVLKKFMLKGETK